jgi:hypothetical protein
LKAGGTLNENYLGGAEAQKLRLEQEGHKIVKKGKNYAVLNHEKALFQI